MLTRCKWVFTAPRPDSKRPLGHTIQRRKPRERSAVIQRALGLTHRRFGGQRAALPLAASAVRCKLDTPALRAAAAATVAAAASAAAVAPLLPPPPPPHGPLTAGSGTAGVLRPCVLGAAPGVAPWPPRPDRLRSVLL